MPNISAIIRRIHEIISIDFVGVAKDKYGPIFVLCLHKTFVKDDVLLTSETSHVSANSTRLLHQFGLFNSLIGLLFR